MMNRISKISAGIQIIFLAGYAAAAGPDFNGDPLPGFMTQLLEAVPAAAEPGRPEASVKEWTVMVFMNGKNDLESFGAADINEMETVGSGDNLNIVVQYGRMRGQEHDYAGDGDWTGTRRFFIKKDAYPASISSQVVGVSTSTDMGSWRSLVNFVRWARVQYPAKRYVLVLWNHGSGWKYPGRTDRGISFDSETGNHITTPQLGQAMAEIGKVDIFATDACLMQMAEVIYEVKDHTDAIIGSEETEPASGYSYDWQLPYLANYPAKPTENLAVALISGFAEPYVLGHKKITRRLTISVVRSGKVDQFFSLVNDWAGEALASGEHKALRESLLKARSYADPDSRDLYDFLKIAGKKVGSRTLIAKGKTLMKFIEEELIAWNTALDKDGVDKNSHGVAVYLPQSSYLHWYGRLKWSREGKWDELVWQLLNAPAAGLTLDSAALVKGSGGLALRVELSDPWGQAYEKTRFNFSLIKKGAEGQPPAFQVSMEGGSQPKLKLDLPLRTELQPGGYTLETSYERLGTHPAAPVKLPPVQLVVASAPESF